MQDSGFLFLGFQKVLCAIQMKGQEAQRSTRQIMCAVPCCWIYSEPGLGYSSSSRAIPARPAQNAWFKGYQRKKCAPLAGSPQKAPCIAAVPLTPLKPQRPWGSIDAGRSGLVSSLTARAAGSLPKSCFSGNILPRMSNPPTLHPQSLQHRCHSLLSSSHLSNGLTHATSLH